VILCLSVLVLEAKSTLRLSVICVQFIQKISMFNACDLIIPVMFVQITITCLTTRSSKRCAFTATLAFGSLFFLFLIFNFYVEQIYLASERYKTYRKCADSMV
jgi:hypothetical protein